MFKGACGQVWRHWDWRSFWIWTANLSLITWPAGDQLIFFEGKGNVWNLNFESECSLIWMKVVWLIFYDSYWLLRNNIIIYRSYNLILLFQWHFQTVMISLFSLFIHFCNNIIWRRWSWLATRLATAYWLSLSLVMSLGQVWNVFVFFSNSRKWVGWIPRNFKTFILSLNCHF